jgi:hypothetical protein
MKLKGFGRYPLETFIDLGFGIAEVDSNGDCVITKYVLNNYCIDYTLKEYLISDMIR